MCVLASLNCSLTVSTGYYKRRKHCGSFINFVLLSRRFVFFVRTIRVTFIGHIRIVRVWIVLIYILFTLPHKITNPTRLLLSLFIHLSFWAFILTVLPPFF